MEHTVLFVDDEPLVTDGLKRTLRKEPYRILTSNSAKEALEIFEYRPIDVVVSDEQMPGMSGVEFLAIVTEKYPTTIRMMLSGQATLDAAIRAINEGQIYRFFTKPCNETDLAFTIRQALAHKDLLKEAFRLLQVSRQQSSIIERLEEEHPELMKVERDEDGAIKIDYRPDELDVERLLSDINDLTKRKS